MLMPKRSKTFIPKAVSSNFDYATITPDPTYGQRIEDGPDTWIGAGLSLVPSGSGNKMKVDAFTNSRIDHLQTIALEPGEEYTLSADMEVSGNWVGVYLRYEILVGGTSDWTNYAIQETVSASGFYSKTFTLPPNATGNVKLHYQMYVPSVADFYSIDNFKLAPTKSTRYRFAFQGQEGDYEISGQGNSLDFGARIYSGRLGRWWSIDKVIKHHLSSYQFSSNSTICMIDPDGLDEFYFNQNYKESRKVVLKDGRYSYSIPQYSRRVAKAGMHEYYYKTGEKTEFVEYFMIFTDAQQAEITNEIEARGNIAKFKDGMITEYSVTPTFERINSPMTFKGGDATNNGYSSIEELSPTYGAERASNFAKTVKPSDQLFLSPSKAKKIASAAVQKGFLDFKFQLNLEDDVLYKIDGVLYNKNEAGNFYFGYAMASLNLSLVEVKMIAHLGTMMLTKDRTYDEPWELDAIIDGFIFYQNDVGTGNGQYEQENINMYANPIPTN